MTFNQLGKFFAVAALVGSLIGCSINESTVTDQEIQQRFTDKNFDFKQLSQFLISKDWSLSIYRDKSHITRAERFSSDEQEYINQTMKALDLRFIKMSNEKFCKEIRFEFNDTQDKKYYLVLDGKKNHGHFNRGVSIFNGCAPRFQTTDIQTYLLSGQYDNIAKQISYDQIVYKPISDGWYIYYWG